MKIDEIPDVLVKLGFQLVSMDTEYSTSIAFKFINRPGYIGTYYGRMARGKRIIYLNKYYDKDFTYCEIQEDEGTRKCFYGTIYTKEQLQLILDLII
jgi:hypothetical protein